MQVALKNYERSTHDLSYIWRSTAAPGTLIPFINKIALPGDTFDINLDADCKTHPTVGPLFGSYKLQLDVFQAPIRLYNGALHNNAVGVGMRMSDIKLPKIHFVVPQTTETISDPSLSQINPSSLLHYLGIKGYGMNYLEPGNVDRYLNATSILAYWEIYKNY